MALFVQILRLFMLFLNIYDAYKTLRLPPPSAHNEGRPSQRALTQRKRNMKGCLAVWIVWCCLVTYEIFVESLVRLFIPFYDEIKSLGLLFLVTTRARGAEPIFLHVIRPMIKPYSPTIDMVLDLARMVGDISFIILAIPVEFAHSCYKRSIFYSATHPDLETDTSQEATTLPIKSDIPVSKRAAGEDKRVPQPVSFPKKQTSNELSKESDRRPRPRTRPDQVGQRVQKSQPSIGKHQIWYPPPSSYSDEEDTRATSGLGQRVPTNDADIDATSNEARAVDDDWRQYPAFPSAYPPTPIVVSSAPLPGPSTAATTRIQPLAGTFALSNILEDIPQQDFSRSLLPPRKPLNPGFVDGLSDDFEIPGVPSTHSDNMSVDSDSEDDDEDIFNTTLQTPIPPLRATRSGIVPVLPINRETSVASTLASRSTVLTTNATNSPLRTHSSSDSISSDALSVSDLTSILGKKRPLPLDVLEHDAKSGSLPAKNKIRGPIGTNSAALRAPIANFSRTPIEIVDELDTDSTFSTAESANDRKPAHIKRRKVGQTPRRGTTTVRPIRPRIAQQATIPTKAPLPKPPKLPPSSSRGVTGASTHSMTARRMKSSLSGNAIRSTSTSAFSTTSRTTKPNTDQTALKGKIRETTSLPQPSKST